MLKSHQLNSVIGAYKKKVDIPAPLFAVVSEISGKTYEITVEKPEPTLQNRERISILKLAIGLAVGGYRYDPKSNRSPVPKEIRDDLLKNWP